MLATSLPNSASIGPFLRGDSVLKSKTFKLTSVQFSFVWMTSCLAPIMNIGRAKQKSHDMNKQKSSNSRSDWLINCWHCRQSDVKQKRGGASAPNSLANYLSSFLLLNWVKCVEKIRIFRLTDFCELEKTGSNGPSVKLKIFLKFWLNFSTSYIKIGSKWLKKFAFSD